MAWEEPCPPRSPRSRCPPEMALLADADPLPPGTWARGPSAGAGGRRLRHEPLAQPGRRGHPLAGTLDEASSGGSSESRSM